MTTPYAARDAVARVLCKRQTGCDLDTLSEQAAAHWYDLADDALVALKALPDHEFQRIRTPGYTAPSPNCPACGHPWAEHHDAGCLHTYNDDEVCVCMARAPQ